jgi:RNA polymerase sigma-70 factor, ECF subfamily
MELVRGEFEERTWLAFWRVTAEEKPPAVVAEELGMTLQAVYKAKSRVLCRLRQELDDTLT